MSENEPILNTIPQSETTNPQQEQAAPSFFSRIYRWVLIYLAYSLVMNLINPNRSKMGPVNSIGLRNIMEDNLEFNINFYIIKSKFPLKRANILSRTPILTLNNLKYTSEGNSSLILENLVEYELDTSDINENKTKEEKLFVYSDIVLQNSELNEKYLKMFSDYESPFFQYTNIFKYSEDLNEQIRQRDMMNDFEAASIENDKPEELKEKLLKEMENKEYIKNLYYKPEILNYLLSIESEVDVTAFEELRMMGSPTRINYKEKYFAPQSYLSDFWTMTSDLKSIEKTIDNKFKIKIKIDFKFITMFYFKYMRGVEMNSEMMENNFSLPGSKDVFVELLKNNSMTYLMIMFTVNILHTVFSILGFASDVSYYKNLKQLDGVYTKHLFFHIFQMAVAMIYVSLEGAHFLVKIELCVGLAVEIWKLKKIFFIEFSSKFPFINLKYKIEFKEKKSKDYETEAVNLMLKYLFVPVAVLYLSYRIYYYKQRLQISVLKFIIEYVFFLMNLFGFILLTPQVYLNYKLQSVRHLPFKALTFKFLNTIIDDLYAFAVKTPTLYRIFCFKDDIIFVILMYQMFRYRNNTRVHEDEEEEVLEISNEKVKEISSEEVKEISNENVKEISKEEIKQN